MIYLDNCATTFVYDEVLEKINHIYKSCNFNPSAAYDVAIDAENEIKNARKIVASSINADENEIFFTSGASESNNTAILQIARANKNKGRHIITSSVEHDSVYKTMMYLKDYEDFDVEFVKTDRFGKVDINDLVSKINDDTILVSIMHVNNETGAVNDISSLGKMIKEKNPFTYFHTDCVQSYMKLEIDVKKMGIDLLSTSAHKIHGVKGSGFLFVKKNTKINPLIHGGGQEMGFRGGTENIAGIASLGVCVNMQKDNIEKNSEIIRKNRDYLKNLIEKNIKDIKINTPEDSVSHILNVAFAGIRSEILLHYLEMDKIYVSTGSACSSKKKLSRVLENIKLEDKFKDGAVRISLCCENTKEQMDIFAEKLQKYVEDIRKVTKYKR